MKRLLAVLALAAITGCGGDVGHPSPREGPLAPTSDEEVTVRMNIDPGPVSDLNPTQSMSNPTDEPLWITKVESIPAKGQHPIKVLNFRLAGPHPKRSISGGVITARQIGAPFLSGKDAVLPPGTGPDDYLMLVRYQMVGPTPTHDAGLRVSYRIGDTKYQTTWNRRVELCSMKAKTCK